MERERERERTRGRWKAGTRSAARGAWREKRSARQQQQLRKRRLPLETRASAYFCRRHAISGQLPAMCLKIAEKSRPSLPSPAKLANISVACAPSGVFASTSPEASRASNKSLSIIATVNPAS